MNRTKLVFSKTELIKGLNFSLILLMLAACAPAGQTQTAVPISSATVIATEQVITATPLPTRTTYNPGTLVDYLAQTGDTLPALAAHFNTTEKEIREANPTLPSNVTTLPPGFPMKIPIYYKALWGNPYQVLPDSLFVDGPAQIGFNTVDYVNAQPGWLKNYSALAGGVTRQGGDLINYVATDFSISPRLLLAVAEYQAGALSQPVLDKANEDYPLGYEEMYHKGFYLQLTHAANQLNDIYYQWRTGNFSTITHLDSTIEHPDPWQNAATVALQNYFSTLLPVPEYQIAIYENGFEATYKKLFGDPWLDVKPHIPGSLTQPTFTLPFPAGQVWAFTGAAHTGWGEKGDFPLAAMDFAPPTAVGGCFVAAEYALAVAPGEIVRSETGLVVLDLDGDGDEHTGWDILYLHMANTDKVRQGTVLKTGDPIGHPSCEGGEATGTHVHIARKYNGEWIDADSALPFVMDGWTPHNGSAAYLGTLTKNGNTVTANDKSSPQSMITAGN
jgi:LysM repeat protein